MLTNSNRRIRKKGMKESKELRFQKPRKRGHKLYVHRKRPMNNKVIKCWKPNILKRLIYWTGLIKDPRYNVKEIDYFILDEAGQWDKRV